MADSKDRSATRIQDDYPAGLYPRRDEYRPPEYIVYMERAAAGLKTVRIVAYSGMVAFIILAAYGFFLIYQLTTDAHRMTIHMDRMTQTMAGMRGTMARMDASMGNMDEMARNMANMDVSTQHMANTVGLIQHSTRNLDRSFGPAMGMMNNWVPWGGGGNRGYQGSPPYSPPLPPLAVPHGPQQQYAPPQQYAPARSAAPLPPYPSQSAAAPSRVTPSR